MSLPVVDGDALGRARLRSHLAVGAPVVGIVASELFVYVGAVDVALWGHLLTVLFVTLAPWWLPERIHVFQAFVLVPVFRLVNLGMPTLVELTVFWFPLVYGPLVPAAAVVARNLEGVELSAGWRPALAGLPLIVPASVVLGDIEYGIIAPASFIPTASDPLWVGVLALVMIGFVGAVEELVFRGILQPVLQGELGRWTGLVVASGVFGVMHSVYGTAAELGFAFGFGVLAGIAYDETDSLVAVVLLHGLTNVFLFGIVPNRGPLVLG